MDLLLKAKIEELRRPAGAEFWIFCSKGRPMLLLRLMLLLQADACCFENTPVLKGRRSGREASPAREVPKVLGPGRRQARENFRPAGHRES